MCALVFFWTLGILEGGCGFGALWVILLGKPKPEPFGCRKDILLSDFLSKSSICWSNHETLPKSFQATRLMQRVLIYSHNNTKAVMKFLTTLKATRLLINVGLCKLTVTNGGRAQAFVH